MSGVRLRILNPEVAGRDCDHCQLYAYDERDGTVCRQQDGTPIRRSPRHKAPCRTPGDSCPKGTPETSKALTDQNLQALFHFLRCEATNTFPRESRVMRNAGLIAFAKEQAERNRQWNAQRELRTTVITAAEMLGISVQARLI